MNEKWFEIKTEWDLDGREEDIQSVMEDETCELNGTIASISWLCRGRENKNEIEKE